MSPKLFWLILLVTAAAGVAALRYSTPKGMGLVNDSVAYVGGARAILAGSGFGRVAGNGEVKPITHFPPLFPLALAGLGLLGLGAIPAAEVLNLALFGGNILLAGLLACRVSGKDVFGLLAAALVAASAALLSVHTFALSEPLFLFLTLASLYALIRHLQAAPPWPKWYWLMAAGFLAGWSYLARYVGAALFAAALLALLLSQPTWQKRIGTCLIFLAAGLPFVLAWSQRNAFLTGSATNRQLIWHPLKPENLALGLSNFWNFLLPSRLRLYESLPAWLWAALLVALLLAGALGLAAAALRSIRRPAPDAAFPWPALVVGLHAAVYLLTVLFSMAVVDGSTLFEDRILAPLYVDLLVLAAWGLARLWARPGRAARWASAILALALLLTFADDARKTANILHLDGQGYANSGWTNSETMDATRRLPATAIYTNRLSAVSVLANRPAYALLGPIDPVTQEPRPDYDQTQVAIHAAVLKGKAVLVVFSAQDVLEAEDGAWLVQLVQDLPVLGTYKDGIIYGAFNKE